MAQEGYGSGAGGWKAPTPTNSDYQVSPVVMGAVAPKNTPASPFQGRAIILPGDPSRLPRRLTLVRSDILDDLESNTFHLQRQNMNTSARLEFSTSSNSSVDASSNENRSSSRKAKKSPLKSPRAGCPGRQCSSQKKESAKKCQARQEDSANSSRRRSTPKNSSRKSLKGYRGSSPRYHPNGTQRPDWLDARQAEVIAAANAKRISGNGGGNDSYVAPPISPEKPRGHFVKVPASVLYRAIQKVQSELFRQKCLGGPSSEEKRRKALGSPIHFDLNNASGVLCSPLQQEKTPKNNGSKSTFIASGAETDPQKSRQIPWNQRQPKNLVRGLSHQWKIDHPGWETGKYRVNLDSTTSETSVEAAPAVESRSQSLPPGGVHNGRRSSRPPMSRRELVEGFLKYQKEVVSRQNNNN